MNNLAAEQAEQLQLFDNYGLWHVPFWQKTWFIICASLVLLSLLALTLYVLVRYMRSRKKVRTPSEQALYDLEMLKKRGLCTVETSSQFYAGLTSVLKTYISSLFMQDVRSNTDQQMLTHIASMPLFDAQKEGLSRIFSAGELIKFAQQDALQEQMQQDWQGAVDFVKNATVSQSVK